MLLVFGSINLDIAFDADHLPQAGETVLGQACRLSPGGKGANQAHAARLDGMPTRMVGAVGDDAFAQPALQGLQAAGVDLSLLQRLPGRTGCAGIVVDARGENQIVVAPGVNAALRADHVPDAALREAGALLLQMETNLSETAALAARAVALGCRVVLNNAPAVHLPPALLHALDVLIVNAGELQTTAAAAGIAENGADTQARILATRHQLDVIVTLGADGVLACNADGHAWRRPARPVQVIDTTGAGDTFAGVFTAALVVGRDLLQAVDRGIVAASLACTQAGAQIAQPRREAIEAALSEWPVHSAH